MTMIIMMIDSGEHFRRVPDQQDLTSRNRGKAPGSNDDPFAPDANEPEGGDGKRSN